MDTYEERRLEDWRRSNLSVDEVEREIKRLKSSRKSDQKRLENMKAYVAEHYVGFDEWIDHQIVKTEQAIQSWDKWVGFEEWLLKQPRYVMSLSAT